MIPPHAHPTDFRLERTLDTGWGELACVYVWENGGEAAADSPDSDRCFLYEVTAYSCDTASSDSPWLAPPDPPFVGWRLRNPTDGRSGPVGLERFSASLGRAWDRHKLPGALAPPTSPGCWAIRATQEYRMHCEICGYEGAVHGTGTGPHEIVRTLRSVGGYIELDGASCLQWRYEITKHDRTAWIEFDGNGYLADSKRIGFGPPWLARRNEDLHPAGAVLSPEPADAPTSEPACERDSLTLPNYHVTQNGPDA